MLKTVTRISLICKINTIKNLVYYLYEEGSSARKVIGNFLSGFLLQSHQVASNGAYMYTLVESCKMSGTSPVAYIKDALCSLIKGETDYLQLIPCNWVKINKINNMLFNNMAYLPLKSRRQPNIERLQTKIYGE